MPKIRIYLDTFCQDIHELHEIDKYTTVDSWLRDNVPAYDGTDKFTLTQGGEPYSKYEPVTDDVDLTLRPEGASVFTVALALTTAHTLYEFYRLSQIKTPENNFRSGSSIYDANVQGNKVRLFGTIPEIFGNHKVYPDILSSPWREFIDNDQWLHMILCVGVGEFEINPSDIYIGNTPITRYSGDVDYQVFRPGENVTGHDGHRNMYISDEVGANSTAIGTELLGPGEIYGDVVNSNITWDFSGQQITYNLNGEAITVSLEAGDLIQVTTATGNNDDLYRIDVRASNILTVTRMLDASTEDPLWTGSPNDVFVTESGILAEAEVTGVEGGWTGPFLATPGDEKTDTIFVDFRMPNGLIGIAAKDGDLESNTINYEIQYRDADLAGDWTSVTGSIVATSFDEVAKTIEIAVGSPSIRPEVRVRRTDTKRTDQYVIESIFLSGLRSELQAVASYDEVTTIAISVKGSNAIAGSAENKFNAVVTRQIPEYEGGSPTWSSNKATREITSALRYIINDTSIDDTDIDMPELARLHAIWVGRGDTFDGVFDQTTTFFEALKSILAPGYAVPIITGGQISMVRDEARSTYTAMYQPDNIIGGISREYTLFDEDEPDGIRVEYFNSTTWRPETVDALLSGDIGADPETIKAFGITDETRAWRLGMRKRRERRYRRKQYRFRTEMDALNSQFGDYVALGDDIPNYSQTGRVLAVDGTTITVDRELNYESGSQFISFRKPDGMLSGPYGATFGSPGNVVEIDSALDFTPVLDGSQEPPLYQFGTSSRWTEPALIAEIKPQGTEGVEVLATNYDARVYDDDDLSPA